MENNYVKVICRSESERNGIIHKYCEINKNSTPNFENFLLAFNMSSNGYIKSLDSYNDFRDLNYKELTVPEFITLCNELIAKRKPKKRLMTFDEAVEFIKSNLGYEYKKKTL